MRHAIWWLALLLLEAAMAQETPPIYPTNYIGVDDAWARWEDNAGLALYMSLSSEKADRLIGLSSPLVGRAELHTYVVTHGLAQMRAVAGIDLPAGTKLRLEPGGLHGMLLDLRVSTMSSRLIPVTLQFLNAGEKTLRVEIRE